MFVKDKNQTKYSLKYDFSFYEDGIIPNMH